jgi:hypothetical protein
LASPAGGEETSSCSWSLPLLGKELRSREPDTGNPSVRFGEVGGGASPRPYSILDGTEDANRDGVRQSNETSPIIVDTDNDGIGDYQEVNGAWCYNGEVGCSGTSNSQRITNATVDDTDGDGLIDGLEIGVECQSYADYAARRCDRGPSTHTDPLDTDTDDDGLSDGMEDRDHDGSTPLRGNETRPDVADTDKDGLCDGNCSGYGEDLNLNGYRDQDSDGNWTETDPLANDSDVDGILDGKEVLGSWCNATETAQQCSGAPNSARILDPLNPDTDGDGLRDGQEIAGWKVLVWREITMEVMATYNVTSDPLHANNDGDNNSDFVEFQNGSDPWKADTDADGMDDSFESTRGMNVTGFYMQPPRFQAIFLQADGTWADLAVSKECRGGVLSMVGCTTYAKVAFQVWSHWGIEHWEVGYGKPQLNATEEAEVENVTGLSAANASLVCMFGDATRAVISKEKCDRAAEIWGKARIGPATISGEGGGQQALNVSVEFQMTTEEDHFNGPWIQARAFDMYGAGAQKTVKLKSSMEKLIDFLAAVAKAIAEAASAFVGWIWGMLRSLVKPVADTIVQAQRELSHSFAFALSEFDLRGDAPSFTAANIADSLTPILLRSQLSIILGLVSGIAIIGLLVLTPLLYALPFLLLIVPPFMALLVAALADQIGLSVDGEAVPDDSRVQSAVAIGDQMSSGYVSHRAGELAIGLIAAGLALTFASFFTGLFAELKSTGTIAVKLLKSSGAAATGLGLYAYLLAIIFPRLLVDAYSGAVGFDCGSLPPDVCGGISDSQRQQREEQSCGFYRAGLVGRGVGLSAVVLGVALSFSQGMAPVGIFGIGTGIWQLGLFIREWENPPPHCDPLGGYQP